MARASQSDAEGYLGSGQRLGIVLERAADDRNGGYALAECHSWDEALTVQSEFTRSSLDRVCSRALKSAEVTAEMFTSSSVPFQECSRKAVERMRREA